MKKSLRSKAIIYLVFLFVYCIPFKNLKSSSAVVGNFILSYQDAQSSFTEAFKSYIQSKEGEDMFSDPRFLILKEIKNDRLQNDYMLLLLSDYFTHTDNALCKELLEKLNHLCFLELHRYISKSDASRAMVTDAIKALHDLYKKEHEDDGKKIYPFRLSLTRMMLGVYITSLENSNFASKKESMLYFLENMRDEFLSISKMCADQSNIDPTINALINALSMYAVREPLMQPRNLKKIVITLGVLAALGYLGYKFLPRTWDQFLDKVKEVVKTSGESAQDHLVKPAVDYVAEKFVDAVIKQCLAKSSAQDQSQEVNSLIHQLGEHLVEGAADGISHKTDKVHQLGSHLAEGAAAGMADKIKEIKEEFKGLIQTANLPPEELSKRLGEGLKGVLDDFRQNVFDDLEELGTKIPLLGNRCQTKGQKQQARAQQQGNQQNNNGNAGHPRQC